MTIDLVDSIDEKLNLFSANYGTDIIAVFPDRKEMYVRDMGQFLKSFFADWDDEVFVDTDHNMRTVAKSVLTGREMYQVFLQDDYTGYTIIGEYEIASDAKEAIENCHTRQYSVTVAMNFELSLTVTASSLSEAEDAAYQYCADTMTLEQRYSSNEDIEDWDVTDTNIEVTDAELV
nr:MAG TPA: hypothetical protein [Caudoviricetes sp.]